MVQSLTTLKIDNNTTVQLRIFVNRKQILQNSSKTTVFEAPLLSNNSIVSLKSPSIGIYLSNTDMKSLFDEIKEEISLILYEVTSPNISQNVLSKLRVGQTMDFQTSVIQRLKDDLTIDDGEFIRSNILAITRVSKFKYKLYYESNWKLDIFIENTRKLTDIRQSLVFNDSILPLHVPHKRRMLIMQKSTSLRRSFENDTNMTMETDGATLNDIKPEIKFKYKPILNLGPILDIHVLERPRRHKS